jgi:hypothetical protein
MLEALDMRCDVCVAGESPLIDTRSVDVEAGVGDIGIRAVSLNRWLLDGCPGRKDWCLRRGQHRSCEMV